MSVFREQSDTNKIHLKSICAHMFRRLHVSPHLQHNTPDTRFHKVYRSGRREHFPIIASPEITARYPLSKERWWYVRAHDSTLPADSIQGGVDCLWEQASVAITTALAGPLPKPRRVVSTLSIGGVTENTQRRRHCRVCCLITVATEILC